VATDFEAELGELQALTDTTLARLGLDDLLDELLDRVRDILDADTAAVLLVNHRAGELQARAARGIEAEVRQGVRVPLGLGFAGRIAATRQPIALERVDATTVTNPILWEKGVKVMLGVPLLGADDVMGVLHVGRVAQRPFGARDAELLAVVATRVAASIQARQLAAEKDAAYLLEQSLVPGKLPSWSGLDIATRYVTAESRSVGGDWYDLFALPTGERWIVNGDVGGHGLEAAVVMGRIRSALRSYALLDLPPEEVLELVDRKMGHFEIGMVATVAVVVTRPPFDSLRIANAGHLPPVLAQPGHDPILLSTDPEPLLGAGLGGSRSSSELAFAPGAVLAMYTDGLVERRDEPIDAGLERLRAIVSADAPPRVTRDIMRTLIGDEAPGDDVALLVVQRTGD
jgi:hypothetical protein